MFFQSHHRKIIGVGSHDLGGKLYLLGLLANTVALRVPLL